MSHNSNSTFRSLLSELLGVESMFKENPLTSGDPYRSLYWREVIAQGFVEDFASVGMRFSFRFNDDGTFAAWHLWPMRYEVMR